MDQQQRSCKKHDFFIQSTREAFLRTCLSCGFVEELQLSPGTQQVGHWQGWLKTEIRPLSWPPCVKYSETLQATSVNENRMDDVYSYRPNMQTSFRSQPQMDRNPFVYSDLPKTSCIRLLNLSPGNRLDILSGRLFEVQWEQERCPSYSALSYTWADDKGDTSPTNLIFLNEDQKVLRITRNCDRALRSLRQKRQSVLLWVDSICINQSSPSERSHQVGLMKTIYSKATTVHAYVGEMECGTDLTGTEAMTLLEDLQGNVISSTLSSGKARSVAILNKFFSRSYFARLWIVQELLLARSIKIHCGEASIQVSNQSICQLYEQSVKVPSWIRYAGKAQSNTERFPMDLSDLLVATSVCQVTDLRDKIFGLLGLVSEGQASDLSPDYELMVREVYIGVAAYLIENHKCCDLIQHTKNHYNNRKYSYGIPSWVPMWDTTTPLQNSENLLTSIQQIELDCKKLLTNKLGLNNLAIRTIEGWPHDKKTDCNRAGKRCKTVHSGSGFLETTIETVFCLPSDPPSDTVRSGLTSELEDHEHATCFYHLKDNIKLAIRSLRQVAELVKPQGGTHLIRVEGCGPLFLAYTTSDSLQYHLVGPCVAAIVCQTKEPSAVESLKSEDLQRFSQFTPLTLEMVQFIAKWRKEVLAMAKSDPADRDHASSIEDQSYHYTSGDESEISPPTCRSWGPFLALECGQVSGIDAKLQRQLPGMAEFWEKAHVLHTHVRQWTKSVMDVRGKRFHVQEFPKNLYLHNFRRALYDCFQLSQTVVEGFEKINGRSYMPQSFRPTERLLNALTSTEVRWVGNDLLGYPGAGERLVRDVDDLIELLHKDLSFLDQLFPLDLSSIHPKYNIVKETMEWKKVFTGLLRTDTEAKCIAFI